MRTIHNRYKETTRTSAGVRFGLLALTLIALVSTAVRADVGIIVALNSTLSALSNRMKISGTRTLVQRDFISGRLNDTPLVVVRSPMGKVNNAITAQLLVSHYPIDYVVSLAPGGAIGEALDLGDIVVADSLHHHDFGTVKPYGLVPGRTPDGIHWPKARYVETNGALIERVLSVEQAIHKNRVHVGTVVTGDQFISSPPKRQWLRKQFDAAAVDMGAAAIGQVCQANGTPIVVIRILTDRAGLSARSVFGPWHESYKTDVDLVALVSSLVRD